MSTRHIGLGGDERNQPQLAISWGELTLALSHSHRFTVVCRDLSGERIRAALSVDPWRTTRHDQTTTVTHPQSRSELLARP